MNFKTFFTEQMTEKQHNAMTRSMNKDRFPTFELHWNRDQTLGGKRFAYIISGKIYMRNNKPLVMTDKFGRKEKFSIYTPNTEKGFSHHMEPENMGFLTFLIGYNTAGEILHKDYSKSITTNEKGVFPIVRYTSYGEPDQFSWPRTTTDGDNVWKPYTYAYKLLDETAILFLIGKAYSDTVKTLNSYINNPNFFEFVIPSDLRQ